MKENEKEEREVRKIDRARKMKNKKNTRHNVILASMSPRRIGLLKQWGLRFKVVPSMIKEKTNYIKPANIVKDLAYQKAYSVAKDNINSIVIGADTIVVINGKITGKPKNRKDSARILKELNGNLHKVYTGVAVINLKKQKIFMDYELSYVKMRKLSKVEISVFSGKHMDKAGAYAVQEQEDAFVEYIKGDYYNVVGLPYLKTKELLKKMKLVVNI